MHQQIQKKKKEPLKKHIRDFEKINATFKDDYTKKKNEYDKKEKKKNINKKKRDGESDIQIKRNKEE